MCIEASAVVWRVLLCITFGLSVAGCDLLESDLWGQKREEAVNLFKRVQDGDVMAFKSLLEKTTDLDPNAAMQLGYVLQTGAGKFPKADSDAAGAYRVASGKIKEADYNLGLISLEQSRVDEAVKSFELAAGSKRDGITSAMVNLGKIYEAGLAGAPRSASLAAEWYEYASNAGDLFARQKFGMMLVTGRGRPVDVQRGLALVENAAFQGSREARLLLATWYDAPPTNAIGRSRELAAKWFLIASDGSSELEKAANAYRESLDPLERKNVDSAVQLWRATQPPVHEPVDYTKPLNPGL